MLPEMLPGVTEMLKALAEAENAVAELYAVFSRTYKEDEAFWSAIVEQERGHARNLERILAMVSAKPQDYGLPKPPNVTVVRTFIRGVLGHAERARKGEIPRRNAFFIARDIETSLLEAKIHELLGSQDPEFQRLMEEIQGQTGAHNGEMKRKIVELGR
ncbi:MAG: hypothetical protein WC728_01490 [Elusimicrobiota bacterium]